MVQFIKDQAKNSDKKIKEAQNTLRDAKKGQDDVSKFFLDGSDYFLEGMNQIQGAMAVAGVLITKGNPSALISNLYV